MGIKKFQMTPVELLLQGPYSGSENFQSVTDPALYSGSLVAFHHIIEPPKLGNEVMINPQYLPFNNNLKSFYHRKMVSVARGMVVSLDMLCWDWS